MVSGIYRFLIRAGKVAGGATFIFGIFYGAYQYYEAKKEKQIEQSLLLFRQFNTPPFSQYREKVIGATYKNKQKIYDASIDEASLEKAVSEVVEDSSIALDLIMMMDFFDGVIHCIRSKVCDTETSISLFHPRAKEINRVYYQYIISLRESVASRDFGEGLVRMATKRIAP